ncbi:MFS transporter [Prauserella halophila]|uniref:MFS transporter n=1 Tax=Prauserella halophila TaxID=185641 RepID=A0ABN1WKB3_9PSEU|nr:MFS transporter [Prauserella halophila]MCP2237618.1 MFS transporter, DHA2 family, multidrug resistance protein [Prauserella halophila]
MTTVRSDSRWLGLAVLTLPVILTSMDVTILHIAVPTITDELAPSPSETLWIVDSYGFLLAGLLIVMGNIGDRIGRRRLLLIGAALFGAASVAAAFAPTAEMLIAARAAMGIGGATLMPSTLSLIRNMFTDPGERTRAIGIWTASLSGGIAVGPIVGGLLLESLWWGSVFLINAPVIVVLLVTAPRVVPEYRNPEYRSPEYRNPECGEQPGAAPLDPLSVVLSFAAILPIVWAIKTAAEELAVTTPTILATVGGLGFGVLFAMRQRRLRNPLVDLGLFGDPRFTGAIAGAGLAMFALVGVMLYNTQYLQLVHGLSPLVAAVAMLPVMLGVGTMAVLASMLVGRLGYPLIFGVGAALAATGMLAFSTVPADGGLVLAVVASAAIGAGIAPMMTLATDVVVASAPPSRSGAASALSETAAEFGAALGIAVLGSIGTAVYRSNLREGLPADVPPDVADTATSSLGAASGIAEYLPDGPAERLTELADSAFVDSLSVAATAASAVLLAAAVGCPALLRRRRTPSADHDIHRHR